nr:MAG TPA: hypothetical protein [Caudoviricetes sp.]
MLYTLLPHPISNTTLIRCCRRGAREATAGLFIFLFINYIIYNIYIAKAI